MTERLDGLVGPEAAFVGLYAESEDAFWLDSSSEGERGRSSFIGDAGGPLAEKVLYDVEGGGESIFDFLTRQLPGVPPEGAEELPFEFDCGFVGYFGYELKAECGGAATHRSSQPDAAFLFADRLIAFDHAEKHTYLVSLVEPGGEGLAEEWIAETSRRLVELPSVGEPEVGSDSGGQAELRFARPPERYLEEIGECKRLLAEGETYEVCLTNRVLAEVDVDPLELYRVLRRVNPASFSAFLRFGEVAVLSSSPERFLRVGRDRRVEAMPVKGTARRGQTPAEDARLAAELAGSEKNRAENLMIADLLRNDLGSVCEVGSVEVPALIEVEEQASVHQLVTTVRGRLREEVTATECVRACFPPGSMTGAPKRRTMEIIDEFEGEARGIYSGALGWLGLGGACDLSVVIRTIVIDRENASVGTGGAIVAQSVPEDELEEIRLKAAAPIAAIEAATPAPAGAGLARA